MKKSLGALKEKFGKFEISKEQVKKVQGGSGGACGKICGAGGGCGCYHEGQGELIKRCMATCGC